MITFMLARCQERSRCDWAIAAGLDLITTAWLIALIWWL
jgi:hypothetical protein